MKIELAKLKVANHLSNETTAFSAEIVVDGKAVVHVMNDGQGGCNRYGPLAKGPENYGNFIQKLEDEAKRIRPNDKFEHLDGLVADLMDKEEDRKTVAKFLKKGLTKVVKIFKGKVDWDPNVYNEVFCVGFANPAQLDGILAKYKAEKHEVLA